MRKRIVAAWRVLRGEWIGVEPCREAPPAKRPIAPVWAYTDSIGTNNATADVAWTWKTGA